MPQDGLMGDPQAMYGASMMMQGGYGPGMQCPMSAGFNQLNAYGQQYQPMQQQFQPDMSGYYTVQNQAQQMM